MKYYAKLIDLIENVYGEKLTGNYYIDWNDNWISIIIHTDDMTVGTARKFYDGLYRIIPIAERTIFNDRNTIRIYLTI